MYFLRQTLSFFLVADIIARAKRRFQEIKDNKSVTISELVLQLEKRDKIDSNREISPLIKANDALIVDTTLLSIDDQVNKLYNIITNNT